MCAIVLILNMKHLTLKFGFNKILEVILRVSNFISSTVGPTIFIIVLVSLLKV